MLHQIDLLKIHIDRINNVGQKITINMRPWLEAKYFTDDCKSIDARLVKFLVGWLSVSKQVAIYPRVCNVWRNVSARDLDASQAVWLNFWKSFRHRFVAVLPRSRLA